MAASDRSAASANHQTQLSESSGSRLPALGLRRGCSVPPWPCGELDQALISLLASAVPLAPAQPVWWLRLSDAAVNLAAVLLLAVMVLRLGDVLLDSDADEARTSRRRSHQLASRWALVFALLVPLQVIGYAWLWADSDSQLNRVINQGESGVAALRSRIQASRSEAELDSLLAGANPGPLPPRQGGSLVERKQQPPRSTRRDAEHLPARHPARVIRGGDR